MNSSNTSEISNELNANFFLNTLNFLLSISALITNTIIILCFIKFKSLRKQPWFMLIAILAIADAWTGLMSMVTFTTRARLIYSNIKIYSRVYCALGPLGQSQGMAVSQVVTVLIAHDRYMALHKPFKYSARNHSQFVLRAACGLVLLSVLLMSPIFLFSDPWGKPLLCAMSGMSDQLGVKLFKAFWFVFAQIVATLLAYYYIQAIRQGNKAIKTNPTGAEKQELAKQKRINKTFTLIIKMYVVSWLIPTEVLILANIVKASTNVKSVITACIGLGGAMNSTVNLFVYSLKSSVMHKYIMALLKMQPAQSVKATTVGRHRHTVGRRTKAVD